MMLDDELLCDAMRCFAIEDSRCGPSSPMPDTMQCGRVQRLFHYCRITDQIRFFKASVPELATFQQSINDIEAINQQSNPELQAKGSAFARKNILLWLALGDAFHYFRQAMRVDKGVRMS
jgi:hypothetical protein